MPFVTRPVAAPRPEDPEALYRTLAETNAGPSALWVHQGEVLRSWHAQSNVSDVAIELPTGAGKTLVGGLIAEYKRRSDGTRAAIVCPTRQLARQTAQRLSEYGVPNVLLVGKVSGWPNADRARYTRAEAVAVTVYAHVFNSNPAIDDAQLLVFDDAHAAEQSVISPWAIGVERNAPLYHELISVIEDALDPLVVSRLRAEDLDPRQRPHTYLASPAGIAAQEAVIEGVLQRAIAAKTGPTGLEHAMKNLQGHVGRALVYVSHASVLIRPLVAPTSSHSAFASPRQRVYMSATLGHGGELERAFGRPSITRIPVPRGWDRQGSGRRFFAVPSLTTDLRSDEQVDAWVKMLIGQAGRALVLASSERQAIDMIARLTPPGTPVLRAGDVEDDLAAFTGRSSAELVLANRYDGIDLPDDDCRLVVLSGLPGRGDLQERFLHDALGAVEVLRERMRARFAQGAGRATRNLKDYAAVVLVGDELINYVGKREVASALHPELQAELNWGFDESMANTGDGLRQDLSEFLSQTPMWHEANRTIIADRHRHVVTTPAGTKALADAAGHEVRAWTAAWQGEWDRAVDYGRRVIDALGGGRDVQRYAALWHYILASWSQRVAGSTSETAFGYLKNARSAGRGTPWLDHLVAPTDASPGTDREQDRDQIDTHAAAQIIERLSRVGRNAEFEARVSQARSGLIAREAKAYEEALVHLGTLVGAESEGSGHADAAPDAMWIFADLQWISWEAKSEAEPRGELGADDTRQAGSHLRFMESKYGASSPRSSFGVIVTSQERVHPSATAVAEQHLYKTAPTTVLSIFDRVVDAWRRLRAQGAGVTMDTAYVTFGERKALPSQWIGELKAYPLAPRDE
ncbi:DEAD/DEAH box helicase [Cellulosimicrobium funkei]